jgi:hypothetical protein
MLTIVEIFREGFGNFIDGQFLKTLLLQLDLLVWIFMQYNLAVVDRMHDRN